MEAFDNICASHRDHLERMQELVIGKDGKEKANFIYGNKMHDPFDEGAILVFASVHFDLDSDGASIEVLDELLSSDRAVFFYSGNPKLRKHIAQRFEGIVMLAREKAFEHLATDKTVISIGIMPTAFIKRDGQRHIHIPIVYETKLNRIERSQYAVSCILSADVIASTDPHIALEIERLYQLDELYSGSIVRDRLTSSLLCELVTERASLAESQMRQPKKHSLLIYHDCNKRDKRKQLLQLLSLVDYDIWDVTLLLQRVPESDANKAFVKSLNSNVRIVCRVGSFSCDADEFIKAQMVLRYPSEIGSFADVFKAMPKQLLANEISRVLPGARFDSFLYCTNYHRLWIMLSTQIDAQRKILLRSAGTVRKLKKSPSDKKVWTEVDRFMMEEYIFDQILFEHQEDIGDVEPFLSGGNASWWDLPVPLVEDRTLEDFARVHYQDSDYLVVADMEYGKRWKALELFEVPDANSALFASSSESIGLDEAIEAVFRMDINRAQLYYFDEAASPQTMTKQEGDKVLSIVVMNTLSVFCADVGSAVFSSCDGYICSHQDDSSTFRQLFDAYCVCTIVVQGSICDSIIPPENAKQHYRDYCAHELEHVLLRTPR